MSWAAGLRGAIMGGALAVLTLHARAENPGDAGLIRPNAAPARPNIAPPVAPPPAAPAPRAASLIAPAAKPVNAPRIVPPQLEKPLLALSETIGSLAFLTTLCGKAATSTPNPWQQRMEGIAESEGEDLALRERLNGAYNQGYQSFLTSYRQCTPAAEAAITLLTSEAARQAGDLTRKFGN